MIGRLGGYLRRAWTAVQWRAIARLAGMAGFDVVEKRYASPIPDMSLIPEEVWSARSRLTGIEFDLDAQIGFVRSELAPFIREFDPPRTQTAPGAYYLNNYMYGPVDAEVLYAMIRRHAPKQLIETGSGFSSMVITQALEANAGEGHPCEYRIFDPYPGEATAAAAALNMAGRPELRRISATDVPVEEYAALGAGDILFADTSHTVKTGGEVNYLILDVLPALKPGVLVHIHDIYLPWEYPRDWIDRFRYYWAEQYLLQAFLAFNADFEVLFSSWATIRERGQALDQLIPSFSPDPDFDGVPRQGDTAWHHPPGEASSASRLRSRLGSPPAPTSEPSGIWLRRRASPQPAT